MMRMNGKEDESHQNGRLKEAIDEEEEKEVFWRHNTHFAFVRPELHDLARLSLNETCWIC